jgi:hypothetical protein
VPVKLLAPPSSSVPGPTLVKATAPPRFESIRAVTPVATLIWPAVNDPVPLLKNVMSPPFKAYPLAVKLSARALMPLATVIGPAPVAPKIATFADVLLLFQTVGLVQFGSIMFHAEFAVVLTHVLSAPKPKVVDASVSANAASVGRDISAPKRVNGKSHAGSLILFHCELATTDCHPVTATWAWTPGEEWRLESERPERHRGEIDATAQFLSFYFNRALTISHATALGIPTVTTLFSS